MLLFAMTSCCRNHVVFHHLLSSTVKLFLHLTSHSLTLLVIHHMQHNDQMSQRNGAQERFLSYNSTKRWLVTGLSSTGHGLDVVQLLCMTGAYETIHSVCDSKQCHINECLLMKYPGASILPNLVMVRSTPIPPFTSPPAFPPLFSYPLPLSPYISPSPLPPHSPSLKSSLRYGECCKLPRGVRGRAPAANAFACILGWEIAAGATSGGDDFPSWWNEMFTCDAIWVSHTFPKLGRVHYGMEPIGLRSGRVRSQHPGGNWRLWKYPVGLQALHTADEDAIKWLHKFKRGQRSHSMSRSISH